MRDPKKRAATNAAYRKKNQERITAYGRAWRYGITVEQMNEVLAKGCGICGSLENLRIDHNHKNGKVRGALCSKHNVGLGQFDDDPELLRRAIAWLEK